MAPAPSTGTTSSVPSNTTNTGEVVIYGRQSLGKDRSIDQQLDLGRHRADAEGWTVHAV